ncbi:MAG: hypothetical protein JSR61_22345 [Proteobacteria bacterium]|nr:hypothetical protein [Pseudomonadota bacterium]
MDEANSSFSPENREIAAMTIASPAGYQVIAVSSATPANPGLLRRLYEALFESRERHAQRSVDAYIARRGYRMTDSLEREIGERMLDGQWMSRR